MERSNDIRYIALNLASLVFFVLSSIFVRYSVYGPCATAFYRILFSLPLLLPLVWKQLRLLSIRDIRHMLIAGALLGINIALWNYALVATSIANATLLANGHVFTVVIVSYLLFKEKIRREFLLGIIVAVAGMTLLVYGKADPQLGSFIGDAAALLSSIFYGSYVVFTYRLRDHVGVINVLFVSGVGCLLILLPLMLFIEGPVFPSTWQAAWPILGITLSAQLIGMGLVNLCLGKLSASLSSVISLSQPAIAALMALAFFSERLTWMEIAGIAVVSCGVYLAQKSSRPRPRADLAKARQAA